MALKILTVLIISMCLSVKSEFPDGVKLCKHGDSECIKTKLDSIFKDESKDHVAFNFPELNPLKFDKARIQQGEGSPVSLDLLLTNVKMYGLNTAKTLKVKGFGKNLTEKHSILLHADAMSTVGDYSIKGKILILPITGNGKLNITMVDVDLVISFMGMPVEKDGATYMHIDQLRVDAEPKNMIYQGDNLFNGDKVLAENMIAFLNENWRDIFTEVYESLSQSYSEIFKDVVNGVFSKHPYDKFFTE